MYNGGIVYMSMNCANLWQSWVVAYQVWTGQAGDPFADKGVTTSFNSDASIKTGGLETEFGSFRTPNTFFGISNETLNPPPPPIPRAPAQDRRIPAPPPSGRTR